jgi:hypothetical protein
LPNFLMSSCPQYPTTYFTNLEWKDTINNKHWTRIYFIILCDKHIKLKCDWFHLKINNNKQSFEAKETMLSNEI